VRKGSLERLAAAWSVFQGEVEKLGASYYSAVSEIWSSYLQRVGLASDDQGALEQAKAAGERYVTTLKMAAGEYTTRLAESSAHIAGFNAAVAVGKDPSSHVEKLREIWAGGSTADALEEHKAAWLTALAGYHMGGLKRMADANAQIEGDFKQLSSDRGFVSWWEKCLTEYKDALARNEASVRAEMQAAADAATDVVRRAYPQTPTP
jgi:hypothetical protein